MTTIQMGGGFHGSADVTHAAAPWMSDALALALAKCEQFERQDQAAAERQRAERAEELAARNMQAAAILAADRGEIVSARDALRTWYGRTPAEAKAYAVAQMDREDALQLARLRRAHPAWTDDAIHAEYSADVTPPSAEELAERKQAQTVERARRKLASRRRAADRHLRTTIKEELLLHEWGY